jgi:DNA (cytosine-5)-methyltransferase 1
MIYGSVCSGIEAATVAWHSLGWKPAFFSEIEKFPRQVLEHHYPDVPLHGDFTTIEKGNYEAIDLLVGGTPCQDFSIAGLRAGITADRGNLTLEFVRLAQRLQPEWLVWENVPGVLSSDGGRALGAFLGALAQIGYGFAYRILDAQYFGVAQRRRRVFVVANLTDWRRAAAVLFESESLRGYSAPRRSEGQKASPTITRGFGDRGYDLDQIAGGGYEIVDIAKTAQCLTTKKRDDAESETFAIAYNITFCDANGTRKDRPDGGLYVNETDTSNTLTRAGVGTHPINDMRVRRLTPMECERLQGFPDNYTNIPNASDGPRYRALGNSMAVPVMNWIGTRIQLVEQYK